LFLLRRVVWYGKHSNVIQNKTIFITGGAGFIGSALAGRLLDDNRIVIYDNFWLRSVDDVPFKNHPNLTVVRGDVLDYDALKTAMQGADIVVHCAAIVGVDTFIQNTVTTMRVNVLGAANVLEAASSLTRCDRVVCFSTSDVFGQQGFQARETDFTAVGKIGGARWLFSLLKMTEEHLAIAYHNDRGLATTVLRPFNIYGPGQTSTGAMRTFIQRAIRDEDLEIHGEGTQIRAWCYVDDMVDGVLRAIIHPRSAGESFNIGNVRAVTTIYALANTVTRVLKSQSKIVFTRKDYSDIELRVPSVEKARDLIDFEAKVDLEEGIKRTAAYYRGIGASSTKIR
jgi:UDP-glucose 4-epimerase